MGDCRVIGFALAAAIFAGMCTPTLAQQEYAPDGNTVLLLHLDGSLANAAGEAKPGREDAAFLEKGAIKGGLDLEKNEAVRYAPFEGAALADGFTVDCWLYLRRPEKNVTETLLRVPGAIDCEIYRYADTRAKANVRIVTEAGKAAAKSGSCLPYDAWFHVAFVYAPPDSLTVRVNGDDVALFSGYQDTTAPQGKLKAGEKRIEIGGKGVGLVDELRVSKVARKPEECGGAWPSGRPGDFLPFHAMGEVKPVPAGADPKAAHPLGSEAIPTFHSMSLYQKYAGDSNENSRCEVRYRKKGDAEWRKGLDLFPDRRDREFRGSLFHLAPDTEYEIELALADADGTGDPVKVAARTWSEKVPVGKTVALAAGTVEGPLAISDRGTPDAWVLYAPPEGAATTIDAGVKAAAAVKIEGAAYVILRNVKVVGGARHAVSVEFADHVRIERCEMTGYGNPGKKGKDGRFEDEDGRLINYHAGVFVGSQSSQVVVENCFMHDPRGTANSWEFGHPAGPQGVVLANTNGNNVVRYNDIVGSDLHRWNDAIESIENGSVNGGPYRDTDIYGNYLLFSNDDSVELDGGQIVVRFWDNRLERSLCGISCAPCRKGPCYVFGNVIANLGDERGSVGSAFKMGGGKRWSTGLNAILHNTIDTRGGGLNSVGYGGEKDRGGYRAFARNNVFGGPSGGLDIRDAEKNPLSSFDYDLMGRAGFSGADGNEAHGVRAAAKFVDAAGADYNLAEGSPGIDMGLPLPGINDGFSGQAPDSGACEFGKRKVIPGRPSGIVAEPGRISLKGIIGEAAAEQRVRLVMPKSAGAKWRAHSTMPWLKCEPAAGGTSDDSQEVVVKADLAAQVPGTFWGSVTFRSDGGYARTVVVGMRASHKPWTQVVEAEACPFAEPFVKAEDPKASGGAYVVAPPESKGDGSIKFEFTIEKAGTYYVIGRCLTAEPCGSHNSFFFSMDGAAKVIWEVAESLDWNWCVLTDKEKGIVPFTLEAGKHTLVLTARERDTRLDKIGVSNNPFPEP